MVAAALEKLVQQVSVGGVYFNAIKPGRFGVQRALAILLHDVRHFAGFKSSGLGHVHHAGVGADEGLGALGFDRRWCYRLVAIRLQRRMGNSANVPELHVNASARHVHRTGDLAPALNLLLRVDAWRECIALTLR